MEYFAVLLVVAVLIELIAMQKVWGPDQAAEKLQAAPVIAPTTYPRTYLASEIRVMEKESQHRKALRAERMGYCLLPRQTSFRDLPSQSTKNA